MQVWSIIQPFSSLFHQVSEFSMFHHELEKLRKILSKNTYSQNFTEKCIFKFLSKLFEHKPKVTTFPKKELKIILSYL